MYYGQKASDVVLKEGYFISDGKYVKFINYNIAGIINNCRIVDNHSIVCSFILYYGAWRKSILY